MRLQAPPREILPVIGTLGTQEGTQPEPVERWIARALLHAKSTEPKVLRDLTLVVDTEVYREMLQTIEGLTIVQPLTHLYGAELEVDHDMPVPFEVRWTSYEEWAEQRAYADFQARRPIL